jgi:hypothetical protein
MLLKQGVELYPLCKTNTWVPHMQDQVPSHLFVPD